MFVYYKNPRCTQFCAQYFASLPCRADDNFSRMLANVHNGEYEFAVIPRLSPSDEKYHEYGVAFWSADLFIIRAINNYWIIASQPALSDGDFCAVGFQALLDEKKRGEISAFFLSNTLIEFNEFPAPNSAQKLCWLNFRGCLTSPTVQNTLSLIEQATNNYRFFGCYQEENN